jgi:glutaminyl-peptide cyclotransferase
MILILFLLIQASAIALGINSDYKVLRSFYHDRDCFCQGIILKDGFLYESGGLYRKSSLRKINAQTGELLKKTMLPPKFFAEGITIVKDKLYMLTWRERTMLVFDLATLTIIDQKSFKTHSGQGWGLTFDGTHLIASDGSSVITRFELPNVQGSVANPKGNFGSNFASIMDRPDTLKRVSQVTVTRNGVPVRLVNELEFVNGFLYANIWYKDEIIKIDPESGVVVETIDMADLWPKRDRDAHADCFNGIAYNASDDSFVVTGKLWPKFYNVKFSRTIKRHSHPLELL